MLTLLAVVSDLAGLTLIPTAPLASMVAFAAAPSFYAADEGYRKLRKELKWFKRLVF